MGNKTAKIARKHVRREIAQQLTKAAKQLQGRAVFPWKWAAKMKAEREWHDLKDFPEKQYRYRFRFVDRIETSDGKSFDR